MASIAAACRLSARAASRQLRSNGTQRGFRTAAPSMAAHNFTMPAMSPTMTEGNIASWKVKEGDSFSAGDVLLEIETDKAQMDVEAQDDGIMAKIIADSGAKSVKVGSRIAVLADPGDDISSLEIPAEDSAQASEEGQPRRQDRPSPQEELSSGIDTTETSPSQAESPPSSKPNADAAAGGAADTRGKNGEAEGKQGKEEKRGGVPGTPREQTYPLYPSVEVLLHTNGLSAADAAQIPASGPNGRLLKGDVLAHLGKIKKDYAAEQSRKLAKMGHLDLSNIKLRPPPAEQKPAEATPRPAEAAAQAPEPELEVAVPVSLAAVLQTQKRVADALGIHLPLSTFIARAVDMANQDLPASQAAPSADELFDAVLGLDKVTGRRARARTSRGVFVPQVVALPPAPAMPVRRAVPRSAADDAFEVLVGKKEVRRTVTSPVPAAPVGGAQNVFSVSVAKGEEKRAKVFLERVKLVLEGEPGRLVL